MDLMLWEINVQDLRLNFTSRPCFDPPCRNRVPMHLYSGTLGSCDWVVLIESFRKVVTLSTISLFCKKLHVHFQSPTAPDCAKVELQRDFNHLPGDCPLTSAIWVCFNHMNPKIEQSMRTPPFFDLFPVYNLSVCCPSSIGNYSNQHIH